MRLIHKTESRIQLCLLISSVSYRLAFWFHRKSPVSASLVRATFLLEMTRSGGSHTFIYLFIFPSLQFPHISKYEFGMSWGRSRKTLRVFFLGIGFTWWRAQIQRPKHSLSKMHEGCGTDHRNLLEDVGTHLWMVGRRHIECGPLHLCVISIICDYVMGVRGILN